MPGIRHPRLTVTPERAAGRATVRVTCVTFLRQEFPRIASLAVQQQDAVFETVAPLRDLHLFLSGDDTFVAELTLTNQETGLEVGARSQAVAVDLAA